MDRKAAAKNRPLTPDAVQADAGLSIIRRSPIQGRSQDKVQRILAATAKLADTITLESITMMQIADAAEASFSSIYRFFPSKDAILEAVAMENLDRLQKEYEAYFAKADLQDGAKIIDDAIDIYIAFAAREPGFRSLWIHGAPTPAISRRSRRVHEAALALAKVYAVERLGFVASEDLEIRLAMAANATTHVLRYAFQQTEFPRDRVIAELKRWLKAALLMLG
jgi:AcrR family transcriptional regulator